MGGKSLLEGPTGSFPGELLQERSLQGKIVAEVIGTGKIGTGKIVIAVIVGRKP
jgi:hypothetical protein